MIIACVFSLAGEWSFFPWLTGDICCHPDSSAVFVAGGSGALRGHPLPPERRYDSPQASGIPQPPTKQTLIHCMRLVFHTSIREMSVLSTNCLPVWCLHISHWEALSVAALLCVLEPESSFHSPVPTDSLSVSLWLAHCTRSYSGRQWKTEWCWEHIVIDFFGVNLEGSFSQKSFWCCLLTLISLQTCLTTSVILSMCRVLFFIMETWAAELQNRNSLK